MGAGQEHGTPHKLVLLAITRRPVTIAIAITKTGTPWEHQPAKWAQLLMHLGDHRPWFDIGRN